MSTLIIVVTSCFSAIACLPTCYRLPVFPHAAPTHYASISNFKSARLNSNTVRMMWAPASLGDSRGVPHYRLRIREGNFRSLSRKLGLQGALNSLPLLRSIDMRTSTSVNVSRLVDSKTYTVQVAVYTTGGQGIYTYPRECLHCTWLLCIP